MARSLDSPAWGHWGRMSVLNTCSREAGGWTGSPGTGGQKGSGMEDTSGATLENSQQQKTKKKARTLKNNALKRQKGESHGCKTNSEDSV